MCDKYSVSSNPTAIECKNIRTKDQEKNFMMQLQHEVPNIKMLTNDKLPG
jgi:hypothetical protein